jgi:glycosyltransferase involved in cell wall biosynthesis
MAFAGGVHSVAPLRVGGESLSAKPGRTASLRTWYRAPRVYTGAPQRMIVQVAIFAWDEEATIADVIAAVPRAVRGVDDMRIAVIDDGSRDQTAALARAAGAHVISHGCNRGLGAAFRSAATEALRSDADVLVTIDGDGQFDARQIPQLIEPLLAGHADMTTCSRFKDPALVPEMPRLKLWGNHRVAGLVSNLTGRRFYDVSCGFRAYSRECLERLNLMGRFTYTHEAIMELVFKRFRVHEVPLAVRGVRSHGRSRVASNLLKYAYRTSRIMIGTLLNHRPHWLFGGLAAACFVLGLLCAIGGSVTWFMQDTFIKSLMLISGFLFGLSVLLVLFGLLARVTYRNHFLLESILYELRVQTRTRQRDARDAAAPEPDPADVRSDV